MSLEYPDEQRLLRDQTRRFLQEYGLPGSEGIKCAGPRSNPRNSKAETTETIFPLMEIQQKP